MKFPHSTIAALVALALFTQVGCDSTGRVEGFNRQVEQAQATSDQFRQAIEQGRLQAEALPPGEVRDAILKGVEEAQRAKEEVDAGISEYLAKIEAVKESGGDPNAYDAGAAGLSTIAKYVPGPTGAIFSAAGLLLAGLAETRRWRQSKAAGSVIGGIEKAKKDNGGVVDFNDPVVKASIRGSVSTEGKALVERVTSKLPA